MFKGTITTATTVTSGTNIPLNVIWNTNSRTSYNNGQIAINQPGKYDVEALFVLTGVAAGNISVQMFNNGTAVGEAIASATSAALTNVFSLVIPDTIFVSKACSGSDVNLSFQLTADATINSAIVTVEEIH